MYTREDRMREEGMQVFLCCNSFYISCRDAAAI